VLLLFLIRCVFKGVCNMGFLMSIFIPSERVVALVKNSPVIKKAKLFSLVSFFSLILSSCAMPAGDPGDVKNKSDLELSHELPLDQDQASATQTASNKKGANAVFSSDAFAAVRSAIDGAQVNQLGDKIPTALAQTAISKTENLINQKANEMANSVGQGKTEISLSQLETKTPEFSIKTIQPLTDLTDESTQLTFTQAQISSGENHGERRATINLGIGQRYLLEDGQSIAGINLFTDYETASKHSRASLGLEYQRANFSANVNKYYPLSNEIVIGDYTEEPLAGYDIRLTGQVPYLPWARIKGTQYHWDAITGDDIKGTRLGVEADINSSTTFEVGTENSNTASRSGYARLRVQLPYNANPASTHFIIADKAFEDSTKLSLTALNYVERSNKIRIEKLLNGVNVVLGEFNATTVGASCTLYNASNVAIAGVSGTTNNSGTIDISSVTLPVGLISMTCVGGSYTDEATGVLVNPAPTLRSGVIYSGTGDLVLVVSPLSEIAYQLAAGDLAGTITAQNTAVATAFGMNGVDVATTIPTDLNNTLAANDYPGKFGTVLAAISQMGENSAADTGQTPTAAKVQALVTKLVTDMADGDIDGIADKQGQNLNLNQAINNFKTGSGDNNPVSDTGSTNAGAVEVETTTSSVIFNTTAVTLDENGTTTYTVVLNTQPTGSVTITPASDDIGAATVSGVMTFTTANWKTPQTVTVTGVNEANPTNETVTISHSIAGADYASVNSANVTATVTDDEFIASETLIFNSLTYITVQSPDTSRVWLDRNLGATKVATSITDVDSYGHLYQWGRPADRHQLITYTSATTGTHDHGSDGGGLDAGRLSESITPGNITFIEGDNHPQDWVASGVDDSGALRTTFLNKVDGTGICPVGFRVPSSIELKDDTTGATTTDVIDNATAFSSFLKIVPQGYSVRDTGEIIEAGAATLLWVSDAPSSIHATSLYIAGSAAVMPPNSRTYGGAIRCINVNNLK
jgi:hypothetical protein